MNACNDVKRPSAQSLDARLVLAAARQRFAAWVDCLVARWLERCAANAEEAQRSFNIDRWPTREFEIGVSLSFDLHVGMTTLPQGRRRNGDRHQDSAWSRRFSCGPIQFIGAADAPIRGP